MTECDGKADGAEGIQRRAWNEGAAVNERRQVRIAHILEKSAGERLAAIYIVRMFAPDILIRPDKRIQMRNAFIAVVILVSIAAAPRRGAFDKPVRVAGGLVSGVSGRNPSVTVFKGLPFAAAAGRHARWREPKPVVAWPGVKKADPFGARYMQTIVDERKPWTYEFMAHTESAKTACS